MENWAWRFGTFVTGFVAGSAPFAAMAVLPAVLNPGTDMGDVNWWALVGLATLVGAVTVIVFERAEQVPRPREVFMMALGIPTLFIGTVSNIGARYDAARSIDRASFAQASTNDVAPQVDSLELLPSTLSTNSSSSGWLPSLVRDAYAEGGAPVVRPVASGGYLVVIGSFRDSAEASKQLRAMDKKGLRTERYAQKALSLYRAKDQTYYLSYARVAGEDEARRIYRLLLINDPQVAPRIFNLQAPAAGGRSAGAVNARR